MLFLRKHCELHDRTRGLPTGQARAIVRDERPWRIKLKHHLFLHLVEEQVLELGNPRAYWTYSDESLMGCVSVMAAATPDPRGMAEQVLAKLLVVESLCL